MAAKSNQQKKAEKLKADKAKGFKSMTFQAGTTTVANLHALCVRYHFEDWRELVTRLIDSTHDNQLADAIPVPRHEFKPTEKMLSKLERLGVLMAAQADEVEGDA